MVRVAPVIAIAVAAMAVTLPPVRASAEGLYLSLGAGADAVLSDDLGDYYGRDVGGVGRMALGKRFGPWALEGVALGTGLTSHDGYGAEALSLGADLKFHVGLIAGLELYIRGGGGYTWLSADAPVTASHDGTTMGGAGLDYGTGLQWRLTAIPGIQLGIWADVGRQLIRLRSEDQRGAVEGGLSMFTLGVTVGRM